MDYLHFLDEFDTYNEWNQVQKKNKKREDMLDEWDEEAAKPEPHKFPPFRSNIRQLEPKHATNDRWLELGKAKDDRVNSPSHYTSGKTEVIDVIEDAVKDAPSAIYGMLQGQVLKYMLRVWLKDNPIEDMKKAQWYLTRLIEHYENPPGD